MVVLGKDFRCGHRNDTDVSRIRALLEPQGVTVEVLEPVLDNGFPVSSTRIRAAIQAGDLHTARKLLGSDFFLHLADANVEKNHRFFSVPVDSVPQVTPANGLFEVTMYDGLPSFDSKSSGTSGGNPAPRRRTNAQVSIENGRIRWPISVGSDFSHIRFNGRIRAEHGSDRPESIRPVH
jgi:hypothetical protein